MAHPILITRPQPGAAILAQALALRLGPDSPMVLSPIMRIEQSCTPLPELSRFPTIVFTSSHAVAPLESALPAEERQRKRAYCVGAATAEAADAAGFETVDGGGDAEHLCARIRADNPAQPLFYARGEHIAADLVKSLNSAGLETHEAVVYRQSAVPLSREAEAILASQAPVVLPLFSPRSAQLIFSNSHVHAPLLVAAMSENVARAVPRGAAASLVVAPEPTLEAMVEIIVALASAPNPVESEQGPK